MDAGSARAEQVLFVARRQPRVHACRERAVALFEQCGLRAHDEISDAARRFFGEVLLR